MHRQKLAHSRASAPVMQGEERATVSPLTIAGVQGPDGQPHPPAGSPTNRSPSNSSRGSSLARQAAIAGAQQRI